MPRSLALALPALLLVTAAAVPTAAHAAPALPTEDAITIASYADTTAWVDDDDGLAVRTGGRTRRLDVSSEGLTELDVGPAPRARRPRSTRAVAHRATCTCSRCGPARGS